MTFLGFTALLAAFAGQGAEEEARDLARSELIRLLRADGGSIRIVEVEPRSWSRGELACGEPSGGETVPGFRVSLEHAGKTYEARVAEGRVRFCGGEPEMQELVEQAKEDLAGRLSISPEEVEVLEAERVTWPDSSLGCPRPGMSYLQVLTEGFRIRLRAEERTYSYHGVRGGKPFLCQPRRR